MTSNVQNVEVGKGKEHPARATAEALALEIGEYLNTWSGERRTGAHPSEGFHRLVVSRMPERLLREALTATRDAVERQRAGKGGCTRGPSAYFAGVVKNLAAENGIDLGLGRPGSTTGMPRESPERAQAQRSVEGGTQGVGESAARVEEFKAALRKLVGGPAS